jgi:hypothetical protein
MLHEGAFEYLKPTVQQSLLMSDVRTEAKIFADALDRLLPEGPDKTYVLRKFREVVMWANVAITRNPDGSPRE